MAVPRSPEKYGKYMKSSELQLQMDLDDTKEDSAQVNNPAHSLQGGDAAP